MQCNQCGTKNDPSFRFCMKCGNPLSAPADMDQAVSPETPVENVTLVESQPPVTETPPSQPVPTPQPVATPSPPPVIQQRPLSQPRPQYQQPNYVQPAAQQHPSASQVGQAVLTYGKQSMSTVSIWGPFAGFGTRRRHIGWLMDNRGDHAKELVNKVNAQFKERQIPGATVQHQSLIAKGVYVENRPYFILKRGLVSLGLHIGQYGKDLFISIVSYLKPPISTLRVIIIAIMTLFWLYTSFIFPNSLDRAFGNALGGLNFLGGGAADADQLVRLLCIVGPLGTINSIALFLFVIFSIYKWLTEKDILAGLRVPPNEFNEDDLMAMEKAVEQTVRIALDEIGLDPNDLKPTDASGRRLI